MIQVNENHPRIRAENYGIGFDIVYPFVEPTRSYPIKDGFELEVILDFRPQTNRFIFKVEGAKNLHFYKQPGAGKDFSGHHAYSWTDLEAFNEQGRCIARRAANAVDSIAVYCDKSNGKYQTGKIGHIFRPEAIDANGRREWCLLDHDHGDLIVTVPWEFLNTASYPVIVDPTLGYTTIGTSGTFNDNTFIIGTVFQMSEAGTATAFRIYVDSILNNFTMGIYDSTSTTPGALLSKTAGGLFIGAPPQWYSRAITGSLVSGNYYGLAVTRDGSIASVFYDIITSKRAYNGSYTYSDGNLTDPFPSPTVDATVAYSWYIEYTAGGGGRTTKNTRVSPLGVEIGMGWRMDL